MTSTARRLVVLLLAGSIPQAAALTDEDVYRNFQFNLINPGGRSLGMGGAFISLADDATAAQANPAGLATLLSPQFFFEVRRFDPEFDTTELDSTLAGDPLSVEIEIEPESTLSPSFVSYARPLGRFALALSRQELINVRNRPVSSYELETAAGASTRSSAGTIEMLLVNWNLSLAGRLTETLHAGVTVSLGHLDLSAEARHFYTDETADGVLVGSPDLAGVPLTLYETESDRTDLDVSLTAGLLWNLHPKVTAGLVWRQGASFEIEEELAVLPIATTNEPGALAAEVFLNQSGMPVTGDDDVFVFPNELHVPDVLGAGLSWRPRPNLTLALDVQRVAYSDLLEGLDTRLNLLTAGFADESQARFTVDDQTNLHLGAEYVHRREGKPTLIFRAGYHRDGDSQLRADFDPTAPLPDAAFPVRGDLDHLAAGFGAVLNNAFQIDLAIDLAEDTTESVISLIYRF